MINVCLKKHDCTLQTVESLVAFWRKEYHCLILPQNIHVGIQLELYLQGAMCTISNDDWIYFIMSCRPTTVW